MAVEDDIIYVVDSDNHRILTFDSDGNFMNKSTGRFKHPRGIAVTSKWIFVCDRGNSRIVILDKGLKSAFAVINRDILDQPHDIACLCDSSQQYKLYITNSNGKIIVLKVYLDQTAEIRNMHIISEAHMGIELEGKNIRSKDLRSICIVNENFLYVTEMCNGGRLICLDLKKGGCCVYTLKRKTKNKTKCRPTIVTHCGNIIAHTESVPKPNRCPGFFLHFFEHTSMYPPHIRFLELTLT